MAISNGKETFYISTQYTYNACDVFWQTVAQFNLLSNIQKHTSGDYRATYSDRTLSQFWTKSKAFCK